MALVTPAVAVVTTAPVVTVVVAMVVAIAGGRRLRLREG
jgi:hypothetical protein